MALSGMLLHLPWPLPVFPRESCSALLPHTSPSSPQALLQPSCSGCCTSQDVDVILGNAAAFSALSVFSGVYFPRDPEIYHLESTAQTAGFIAQNQETLTFKACLKSIFHAGMRQTSPTSAPGAHWAPVWSRNEIVPKEDIWGLELHRAPCLYQTCSSPFGNLLTSAVRHR